jgi:hypothetical protein
MRETLHEIDSEIERERNTCEKFVTFFLTGKPDKELMNSDTYWIGVCSALKSGVTNLHKRALELVRSLQLKGMKQYPLELRILSDLLELCAISRDQNVVNDSLELFSTFLKEDETMTLSKCTKYTQFSWISLIFLKIYLFFFEVLGTSVKNPTRFFLQNKQRQLYCIDAHKKLIQTLLENPKLLPQILKFLSQIGYRSISLIVLTKEIVN